MKLSQSFSVKLLTLGCGLALAASVASGQATVLVNADIAVSTTWTANNVYNLQTQIYVLPGATLTIEAGTVIASTTNMGGSLAVTRGAQIFVQGTSSAPVIMTSTSDRATWTANDPTTGMWREAANEWGNLTIMGAAYISENATVGNTAVPNPANFAIMEGLVAGFPGDTRVQYGGGNDNDDSGSIEYLSLRYGGRVVALNVELNGLSLGGIGRGTTINHVEIMNNVDDGIEIWGGTVNLRYLNIWNIGDDSLDIDQGWRGKAQFGLIVQGYSLNASQGSGVGDNAIEMDGAENSDWQPVTTGVISNFTVVGQPIDGDRLTAWRDNARMQFHNSIFMDGGEEVVGFDNLDGDGASGYGFNGTLTWPNTWTTPYTATSAVNAPAMPALFYTAQTSGNLIEFKDCVFYRNLAGSAYTEANNRMVFAAANNNVQEPAMSPITALVRGPSVIRGGKVMQPVTYINPVPQGVATTAVNAVQNDGICSWAGYRGAFRGCNWLVGWTATDAFGFTGPTMGQAAGPGQAGVAGAALLDVNNAVNTNGNFVGAIADPNGPHYAIADFAGQVDITINGQPNQPILFVNGTALNPNVFNIGALLPGAGQIDVGVALAPPAFVQLDLLADGTQPGFFNSFFNTGPTGTVHMSFPAVFAPGTTLNLQALVFNTTTLLRCSNAVQLTVQ